MDWLEEYSGESTAQLLGKGERTQRGCLLEAFHQGLSQKSFRLKGRLSEPELFVLALTVFDQEVKMGGYSQFLVNSSKRFVPVIVRALQDVGAVKKSELTKRVLGGLPEDWETLSPRELSRRFQSADETYYALDRGEEDHDDLLWNYIRQHEFSIVLP